MQPHIVKLAVVPRVRIECKFWPEDDGWNAAVESLGVNVHAEDFQSAKHYMEVALGELLLEAALGISDTAIQPRAA